MKKQKLILKKLKRKKFNVAELLAMQALPLNLKIEITQERIREFFEYMYGQVYIALSGGKDSTVLLMLVRELYPEVIAVFQDTGLEYPEIRAFVKTIKNVVWLKPEMTFRKVLEEYGYPIISKQVARGIRDLRNASERNAAI